MTMMVVKTSARFVASAALASALLAGTSATAGTPGEPSVKHMSANGADLTYQEQGEGPTVVFVHGALGDYRVWDGVREATAAKHHFVALTLRYYGTGAWPDDGKGFSFATEAEDIAAFIEGLHRGPVDLVAWSMGGPLALFVATKHPELVKSLFLYETSDEAVIDNPERRKAATDAADLMFAPVGAAAKAAGSDPTAVAAAVAKAVPGVANGQPGAFDELPPSAQSILLDNARTGPLTDAGWPPPAVTCEQVGRIKVPVAFAIGEETVPFFRMVAEEGAKCLPGSTLVVVPKARHMAPVQDPAALNAALSKFLDHS